MINVSRLLVRWGLLGALSLAVALAAGCKSGHPDANSTGAAEPEGLKYARVTAGSDTNLQGSLYPTSEMDMLHAGDNLTIEFSDIPISQLPREERIKEDGTIRLLEGKTFVAAGKTRGQLEKEILDYYVPKYYVKMTVSVRQQKQTQFYYVRGEVKAPGRQVYIDRVTVLKAIGAAGDFTDFARKSEVELVRADGRKSTINAKKALKDPRLDLEVFPGDYIYVHRRGPIW